MNLKKLQEAPAAGIYEASASRHPEKPQVVKRMQQGTSTDDVRCQCQSCGCDHCMAVKKGSDPGSNICPCSQKNIDTPQNRTFMQKVRDATTSAQEAYKA